MGYTLAEKILGAHAGRPAKAGEVVVARVDFAMIHDARAANALQQLDKLGAKELPFASRTAFVLDHYSPPPNAEAANTHMAMRRFCDERGAVLYDVGDGICHQVLPEGGHLITGDEQVVISSANRNFKGRLGNSKSEIWIGSAATVAASALTGRITDPREVSGGTWRAAA